MAFSDPQKNIDSLGLAEGSYVADLGAGSGFYTLAAAHTVGAGGRVYAIDVQQELLTRIKSSAHAAHYTNVEIIHGDIERLGGTRLKDQSIDVAFVCNILFQVEKKDDFIIEVKRILKSGGRVLVVDWAESFGGLGPHPDHVVTEDVATELFKKHGFVSVNTMDAGDHHYGFVVRKN
ncbi:MAG: methyltransferase domain-containing protein [Patescibacteria group bacterium]